MADAVFLPNDNHVSSFEMPTHDVNGAGNEQELIQNGGMVSNGHSYTVDDVKRVVNSGLSLDRMVIESQGELSLQTAILFSCLTRLLWCDVFTNNKPFLLSPSGIAWFITLVFFGEGIQLSMNARTVCENNCVPAFACYFITCM